MEPVARRPPTVCCTTPWASSDMGWTAEGGGGRPSPTGSLLASPLQPECCAAAAIQTTSAVAEGVIGSTL
eukprot:1146091-Prymnesium_polylepis.1